VEAEEDVEENVRARGKDCFEGVLTGGPCDVERLALEGTLDRQPGSGGRALFLPSRGFLPGKELGMRGEFRSCWGVTGMGMLKVEPEDNVLISLFEDSTEEADSRVPGRRRSRGVP
jgi:hypothetical protein